ncbi:hypothetical protein K2173_021514 [Erythroxylum novogranatense]|uniref:FLZ-type domain-containing protein n=1 Tax=Erythroxylum novogranatense TaxID=1862640 RepID=A0AAV8TPH7_9ROSI|nr:hypothetical protein K2173_021514 [Erythroxylum novogranatense]
MVMAMSLFNDTTDKCRCSTSFPRLFTGFSFKNFSETTETVLSPTSILDGKLLSGLKNSWSDQIPSPKNPESETKRLWDKLDSKGIVLGLADALDIGENESNLSKPQNRMVLFGSQLKIQIPTLPPSSLPPTEPPNSSGSGDYGIKTKTYQLGSFSSASSPSPTRKSIFRSANSGIDTQKPARIFTGCLSASEMELSEDYTCVISHGPNPVTTHIFDNCILESGYGSDGLSYSKKGNPGFCGDESESRYVSQGFLSCCYACKNDLGQGKDIYIYRGEKAFCSNECRHREMLLEERINQLEPDDVYGTCS